MAKNLIRIIRSKTSGYGIDKFEDMIALIPENYVPNMEKLSKTIPLQYITSDITFWDDF